ncbi:2-dehydropantoate 2-reductase [Nitrospirillum viridazoti Y2]|uniref:2-dehydropantoate 2-reductase n=1 Tax=Nitrospirillum amazonense TaxID=28077 RepID=A0A560HVL8_9PROT|nr:2-dehydropantoate 2-reductase [Nitrospirillum amazonense]EGX99486.1 2-dehydropantoate 2-reductase [Nitrospirillum amazonense Y2]TWB50666.1 ketopantoate reductase [Nitrospirillum amazonense]
MRIVVVGAGAMGTLFGGRLARAGHEVAFIETDAARVDAINADGVFENDAVVRCRASLPGATKGNADLLILFTKSAHTGTAIRQNAGLLATDGQVLTLQNGLGNGRTIAGIVGTDRVLVGITNWPADLVGHGRIHVSGAGTVKLWSLDGVNRPVIHHVASALDDANLCAAAEPSVEVAIWEKVIFNAALNGIAALTGLTVGQIGEVQAVRSITLRLVAEGVRIAHASGAMVEENKVLANVSFALANHRDHKPSMLQDVEAGRITEVDAIQGGLLDAATAHGLTSPVLETCTALLRGVDARSTLARHQTPHVPTP